MVGTMASKEGDWVCGVWCVQDSDGGGWAAPGGSWVEDSDGGEAAVGEGGDSSTTDDGEADGVGVGGWEVGNVSHGGSYEL